MWTCSSALLALSAGTPAREPAGLTSLPPVSLLDGFGRTTIPSAEATPIPAREFSKRLSRRAIRPACWRACEWKAR